MFKKAKAKCNFKKETGTYLLAGITPLRLNASFLHLKPRHYDFMAVNVSVSRVNWYSFCREVIVHHLHCRSEVLGIPGFTVEIGEAPFGKRKYNQGKRVKCQWVFSRIEQGSRESFFVPKDKLSYAET